MLIESTGKMTHKADKKNKEERCEEGIVIVMRKEKVCMKQQENEGLVYFLSSYLLHLLGLIRSIGASLDE